MALPNGLRLLAMVAFVNGGELVWPPVIDWCWDTVSASTSLPLSFGSLLKDHGDVGSKEALQGCGEYWLRRLVPFPVSSLPSSRLVD